MGNIDDFSPAGLKLLVVKLVEEVADLRRTVAAQRDEIARLKGRSASARYRQTTSRAAWSNRSEAAGWPPRAEPARRHASEADDQ